MSERALDLRRSLQIVRRHLTIVGMAAVLGLLAGVGYTLLKPPMLTSKALVVLPSSMHDTATQVVIASSNPVLADALRSVDPAMSLDTLRSRLTVKSLTYNVILISAQGQTATEAEDTANAVAGSYVGYLSSGQTLGPQVRAKVLEPATAAAGTPLPTRLFITGGLGALLGLAAGVIVALAIGRADRRLRERDAIADSIGVPVLASFPVAHPSDAAGWTKLLENYEPGAVDGWRLRTALQNLGLVLGITDSNSSGASLAVLSLSSDRKALALGPQLAVFAASLGIPTTLVVGPQQDANTTATLRAACAAPRAQSRPSRNLRITVTDHDDADLPGTVLTIVVSVVDGQTPRVADTMRTTATVLGVTAGAATAEQLARVAASAAENGSHIAGILVADPDSDDHTTGYLPQLARPAQRRMPTRITGTATETRP
jgi:capsular polysaccharide biosynthesis protein